MVSNRNLFLQGSFPRWHVSFQECNPQFHQLSENIIHLNWLIRELTTQFHWKCVKKCFKLLANGYLPCHQQQNHGINTKLIQIFNCTCWDTSKVYKHQRLKQFFPGRLGLFPQETTPSNRFLKRPCVHQELGMEPDKDFSKSMIRCYGSMVRKESKTYEILLEWRHLKRLKTKTKTTLCFGRFLHSLAPQLVGK